MTRRLCDGNTKATFVASISNINAPTATELNAGSAKALETLITDTGLAISIDEGAVTGGSLADVQDFEQPGRHKPKIELTYFRDTVSGSDVAWSTLTRAAAGFLVVRRGVAYATNYAAGDKVEVYPITCGKRRQLAPEREGFEKAMTTAYVTAAYTEEATVV